jgi:hypothetical protein
VLVVVRFVHPASNSSIRQCSRGLSIGRKVYTGMSVKMYRGRIAVRQYC